VNVCGNCGKEVEAGQKFCPYCAQPLGGVAEEEKESAPSAAALQRTAEGRSQFLSNKDLEPPSVVPLSSFDESKGEESKSQRKLFIIVGAATIVVLGALALLFSTNAGRSFLQSFNPPAQEERLEGALRPGSPEFDEAMQRIRLDFIANDQDATTSERAIGDKIVTMKPTIRNFTNRTINGIELRARAYDLEKNVLKERTYVVIPKRQSELAPNNTYSPELLLEGFKQSDFIADLSVEITGLKFKE
jgi:hypothetical protein